MVDALAVSKRQQQQLVTDASHELRTPLTSLRTNAELLDRPGQLNAEQQQRAVQGIRLEVNELTDLVSELVELATDRAPTTSTRSPCRCGRWPTTSPSGRAAGPVARSSSSTTATPEPCSVGPHMAERALANLVDNAVKYSPGAIAIVVTGRRVEVRDDGPGIAPTDQPTCSTASTDPPRLAPSPARARPRDREADRGAPRRHGVGRRTVPRAARRSVSSSRPPRRPPPRAPRLDRAVKRGSNGPMDFGIFMAPFHPVGQNPTLALERDLELIQHLDRLGFDEAWVGEHHSAGYEIIASPEVFIGIAAERTKHIKLGTGVSSLPYHHPLLLADRMVLLDHLTRGRTMLGVGPGQLTSDAHMLGIPADAQRPRMEESLDAIMALLRGETVTMETDGFILHDAPAARRRTAIRASTSRSPRPSPRPALARRASTASACSRSRPRRSRAWTSSATTGTCGRRSRSRTDTSPTARSGASSARCTSPRRASRPRRRSSTASRSSRATSPTCCPPVRCRVTTPEEIIENNKAAGLRGHRHARRRDRQDRGAHRVEQRRVRRVPALRSRLGDPAATLRSAELFAQYVMPKFQGQLDAPAASCDWVTGSGGEFVGRAANAIAKAIEDHAAERSTD